MNEKEWKDGFILATDIVVEKYKDLLKHIEVGHGVDFIDTDEFEAFMFINLFKMNKKIDKLMS